MPRFLKRAEIHHWLLDAKSYVTTSEAAAALGCTIELVDLLAAVPNKTARSSVDQKEVLGRLADQKVDPIFEGFRQREKFYCSSDIEA